MKSASTSPASPIKKAHGNHMLIESDMENDTAEQNIHDGYSEAQTTSPGYDIHQKTEVVHAVLPQELHESSGNDQQETTHSDAYLGDAMLAENTSRDYHPNNSAAADEIPSSSVLQMENVDTKVFYETSNDEKNETEDDQMNGRNSSPRDECDDENFNSAIAPSYLEGMEQENTGAKNCMLSPRNQWDSPEISTRLEKRTPSPDRMVSLSVERSPHALSSKELDSPHPEKEARQNSPPEKKARREHRHGDGSPRRRSVSPRRRALPKRRDSPSRRRDTPRRDSPSRVRDSPRRESPSRRRDSPRRESPSRRKESPSRRRESPSRRRESPSRRRDSPRRESPSRRRDSPSRRRDSPRRRHRSKSMSPSRKTDGSRHRREHGRSRSRSPHPRDHHRRSPRRHSPRRRSSPSHRHHSPRRPWSPPANRKTGLGKPGRNLFVAGFSYATTERDLEKKFSKYGRVTSARVVRDKRSGDSRGFGFLSLERDEDADAAIRACDETEWNGRIILVEKSKAPTCFLSHQRFCPDQNMNYHYIWQTHLNTVVILGGPGDKMELAVPFNVCKLCSLHARCDTLPDIRAFVLFVMVASPSNTNAYTRKIHRLLLLLSLAGNAMGSYCCMGCNDDDGGGGGGEGGLDPKGFLLAMMIALVLLLICIRPQPRRNSYVVYRCY
ncbi:hypothetical protein GUJ93_ZPchr0008g12587 [Zizania palustris]|uniref:RRM domain-containing protein n=1 Tax=Zizania palustris TaxID=103762 RepID=A0A8J5VI94_ZIZPA|nr:hypothetical protein GUJ93_ZPchr0008g12587 [Zizania palustris]